MKMTSFKKPSIKENTKTKNSIKIKENKSTPEKSKFKYRIKTKS